jgi:hypothetical protein
MELLCYDWELSEMHASRFVEQYTIKLKLNKSILRMDIWKDLIFW